MVVTPKHNGDPRRTVDMTELNKASKRQTHHTIPPFKQATSVPTKTKKTTLDAWNGYHSVLIREEDRHLTTFITPWGRYRYRTAPQGYLSSGDAYTYRYDQITANLPDHTRCVDDTLLWSNSIERAFHQTTDYMTLAGTNGIILNPDKFHFAEDNVELRAPDHRYRPQTLPTALAGILDTHGCAHVTPEMWELADKSGDDLLDAQSDAVEALRGLEGSTYLTIDGGLESVAHRDGWKSVGERTWLLPESAPTHIMLQAYLGDGAWQMYKAPSPAQASELPDLFNADPPSLSENLTRLGIVALIDAWRDSTEWRVAVVPSALFTPEEMNSVAGHASEQMRE